MSSDFIDYVSELLSPLGSVRAKRMFGGTGIYINELFCAIIFANNIYFKCDDENEDEFVAAKCAPFTYQKDGATYSLRYYCVPEECLDNALEMERWATLGLAAALRKAANPTTRTVRSGASTKNKPKQLKK